VKKCFPLATVFAVLFCALIVSAFASETFAVPALQQTTRTVNLSAGTSISGTISVTGGTGKDINFNVTDPNGNIMVSDYCVTDTCFNFFASTDGAYTMIFDNTFSSNASKTVTLDYSAQPVLLGVPESSLSTIGTFIVIVVIAALVVALLWHSRKNKPNNHSAPASPASDSSTSKMRIGDTL
jgi:hypothetical protein